MRCLETPPQIWRSAPHIYRRGFLLGALASAAIAAPNYRIIDSHVHVWKKDPRYPWAKETTRPPAEDATAEMLLALMKANGVERTVIIQVIHYRWDNSYLADVLKQYPKEFHGVARVNPEDPAAPDHLSKLTEQRFRGVRLSPAGNAAGDWINGPLMPPLWKRCQELKVPMTLLMPVTRVPDAQKLIEKFPDLTVVIDHMTDCPVDKPEELEKLIALKRYPKVFVKISHTWSLSKQQYPWRDSQEHVKRLHAAFGPRRLMWGTDWPVSVTHTTYDKTLAVVRDEMKFLNDDDKSWMLSKTIEQVWPFPA
ncbi:MAG: amidohydrolase family protein [Candidatus Solibacter usitatus]|nr:amidohydrolase family protein [Candidatus Solibacter usitatus]